MNRRRALIGHRPAAGPMQRQRVYALLPLDRVNANYRCLAGEFDRSYDRIELCGIEISLELIARFPFFNEQQPFSFIEV